MTKPNDAASSPKPPEPPKPASEKLDEKQLDEKDLEQVSGGVYGLGIFKDEAAIKGE